jgi:hypothetical protein
LELYRATTVRHLEHPGDFGTASPSHSALGRSPWPVLHPGIFVLRGSIVKRDFANSGDGAAADMAVGVFSRPERRHAHPESIWSVHLISNGRRWRIPFRLRILLKRPCVFQLSNPQSKAYFRIT